METDTDNFLTAKNTKELTKAAKYLLKVEYNQMQKYLGYANTNALTDKDPGNSGDLTNTDYTQYTDSSTIGSILTRAQLSTAF